MKRISIEDRFWKKVSPEPNSGCWLWTACVFPAGYGKLMVEGKTESAHRVSYRMHVGEIPDGLELDHLCRVRCCVNPDHLEPVTRSVNVKRGLMGRLGCNSESKKTHCPGGHPYSGDNLVIGTDGSRRCKACKSVHYKNWRERRGRKQAENVHT